MSEINTINGYEIADKKARFELIETTTTKYDKTTNWLCLKYENGLTIMFGKSDLSNEVENFGTPTSEGKGDFTIDTITYPITLIEEPIHISYGGNFDYVMASPVIAEGELKLSVSLNTMKATNEEVQTYIKNIGSSLTYNNTHFKYSVCVIGKWK